MISKIMATLLTLVVLVTDVSIVRGLSTHAVDLIGSDGSTRWRETTTRIVMKSTADWARMLFDDWADNNTNGIRLKYVLSYGWLKGNDSDDEITFGNGTWSDLIDNTTVKRTGYAVAFNKQRDDFDYTEMYVDAVFDIDSNLTIGIVWLMLAGQGITVFRLVDLKEEYTLWEDTLPGTTRTSHVKRCIMTDLFFRKQATSHTSVALLSLIVMWVAVLFVHSFRRGRRHDGVILTGRQLARETTRQKSPLYIDDQSP